MSVVTLKGKDQITVPAAVRTQIGATTGGIFEVVVKDGNIILVPKDVGARPANAPAIRRKGQSNMPPNFTGNRKCDLRLPIFILIAR